MAVYYTIRCPQCNKVLGQGKNRSKRYGSPLCRCRFCGSTYIDKDYIETGLLTEKQLKLQVVSMYAWNIAASLFLFFLGLAIMPKDDGFVVGLVLLGLGVLVIVPAFRNYRSDLEHIQQKARESSERLANPYYVLALHKAKISVPKYMVEQAEKEISKDSK